MRKLFTLFLLTLLVLISAYPLFYSVNITSSQNSRDTVTRYGFTTIVDQNGSGDHTDLNIAIETSNYGDTIELRKGIYTGSFRILHSISIIGTSNQDVIITNDINSIDRIIEISASNCIIENITIKFQKLDDNRGVDGIKLNGNNNVIRNCNIVNFPNRGIFINGGENNKIVKNNISSSYYGIHCINNQNNEFLDNRCINNSYGIYLDGGVGGIVDSNYCNNNSKYDIYIQHASNIKLENNIADKTDIDIKEINKEDHSVGIIGLLIPSESCIPCYCFAGFIGLILISILFIRKIIIKRKTAQK
jgi:parallel beta-helix repeat protein